MKKIFSLFTLVALSLGFSSCCSMFGLHWDKAGDRTETRQVVDGYDTVYEQVYSDSKSGYGSKGGMTETVEKQVPRYKTVTKKVRVPCPDCVRYYCPKKECCGTTSKEYLTMVSAQGSTGAPHIGLAPTMKRLAE
ncbi:MAG: hypothetical protein ABJQ29_12245 [Luteolibacter sp.]